MDREDVKRQFSAAVLRKLANEIEECDREARCRYEVMGLFENWAATSYDAEMILSQLALYTKTEINKACIQLESNEYGKKLIGVRAWKLSRKL